MIPLEHDGSLPSVVYRMVASGVADETATSTDSVKTPPGGVNVGVPTRSRIVNVATASSLSGSHSL